MVYTLCGCIDTAVTWCAGVTGVNIALRFVVRIFIVQVTFRGLCPEMVGVMDSELYLPSLTSLSVTVCGRLPLTLQMGYFGSTTEGS